MSECLIHQYLRRLRSSPSSIAERKIQRGNEIPVAAVPTQPSRFETLAQGERDQAHGYLETILTARHPGLTFRNLGWSGDTVFGEAQASHGHAYAAWRWD